MNLNDTNKSSSLLHGEAFAKATIHAEELKHESTTRNRASSANKLINHIIEIEKKKREVAKSSV